VEAKAPSRTFTKSERNGANPLARERISEAETSLNSLAQSPMPISMGVKLY
jgi:hypothetical protein